MRTYTGHIKILVDNGIFVFGSNTEGRHGKGAALVARLYFGAKYGQAKGLQGKSYAIITKDLTKKKHPSIERDFIIRQILVLYSYAMEHPELDFYIAYDLKAIPLNGYNVNDMAEMFNQKPIPENIIFEEGFATLLK